MQLQTRLVVRVILSAAVLSGSLLPGGCDRRQQQSSAPPAIPEVVAVTAQPQKVVLTTELPGRTSPYLVAEIRPQVNGLVQKRLFTEGSDVQAGQVLYQIDPAPFQAALDSARAALARSEASLPSIRSRVERYKDLLDDKAVSQQDYDDAVSALNQAEADIQYWRATAETARINLDYTRVTAPISGRIGRSSITDGALVTAYQPVALATIQQLDPIYVDVRQSTATLLRLKQRLEDGRLNQDQANQNKVELILDGTKYSSEGTLQFRDVTVDPTTGSVIVRAVFPNPQGVLLPGMFVRAVVKEGVNDQAILIPQQAVSRDPKGRPVTMLVDGEGKVQQRTLVLDRAIGSDWLVLSGLAAGDRVITEGVQKVRPGAAVKVASSDTGPQARAKPAAKSQTDGGA
ncbi:MAG TPA: efflux RND transporter periplasmic adaptor subunit [Sedimentisphaerales bacterium]|jgi:membrane fusion protein (multidrug efflux system)|nr:efflux RND transporter periplasmic adaptor subunit [Sedimentisphaerales bacterium]HNU29917.1 efflux RND transporter periplasmic adaptor subunit [Sedimentisphaerales bacterium]